AQARAMAASGFVPWFMYWLYANTGSVIIWFSNRLVFMLSVKPAVNSSGAVSPMTRAMASITLVAIPAIEVGMTTFRIVSHLGTPSAYDASRSSFGTIRN